MKQSEQRAKVAQSSKVKSNNKVATKKDVTTVESNASNAGNENFDFSTLNNKQHHDIIFTVVENITKQTKKIKDIKIISFEKSTLTHKVDNGIKFSDFDESGIYYVNDIKIYVAVVKNVFEKSEKNGKHTKRPTRVYMATDLNKNVCYTDSKTSLINRLSAIIKKTSKNSN